MLDNEDRDLVGTLIQEEISRSRRLLKEAIAAEMPNGVALSYEVYLLRLQELLSRVLFS